MTPHEYEPLANRVDNVPTPWISLPLTVIDQFVPDGNPVVVNETSYLGTTGVR